MQHRLDKLIVFGGGGFLGQRICKYALNYCDKVISITRSGKPNNHLLYNKNEIFNNNNENNQLKWHECIEWNSSNAANINSWIHYIDNIKENEKIGILSCISLSPFSNVSYDTFININGEISVNIFQECLERNIDNICYISAIPNDFPLFNKGNMLGYFDGKKLVEDYVLNNFQNKNATILRPALIYGPRLVEIGSNNNNNNNNNNNDIVEGDNESEIKKTKSITLPLHFFGKPFEFITHNIFRDKLAELPYMRSMFTSPINVEDVAKIAVLSLCNPSIKNIDKNNNNNEEEKKQNNNDKIEEKLLNNNNNNNNIILENNDMRKILKKIKKLNL